MSKVRDDDMAIRNACKLLLIDDGKILLNRNHNAKGEPYYGFPGGGQNQYETLEDAVRRESLEETGYPVEVLRLAAIHEEIFDIEDYRAKHPDYAHRIYFFFLCRVAGERRNPTEIDENQDGTEWIALDQVPHIAMRPPIIQKALPDILGCTMPLYLPANRIAASK